MAYIDNIGADWTTRAVTTAAEVWQCRSGVVMITLETTAHPLQGHVLNPGESFTVPSGKIAHYRRASTSFAAANVEKLG